MEKIYSECPRCVDGIETVNVTTNGGSEQQEITCTRCGGDNKISSLSLSGDLIDYLTDMNNKLTDVLEKLNE